MIGIKQLLLDAIHRDQIYLVDYAYRALDVLIEPLQDNGLRKCLERYIDSTCVDDVVVNQIFRLDRKSEKELDDSNVQLLFHGSRNINVLGILQQGLRIAPPEAPVSGYAYGKGIYFSDQFSKAFHYTSLCDPKAYVFVAEVALGASHVATEPEYMEQPRDGTHSTIAPGPKAPNPRFNVVLRDTGATVPLGELEPSKLILSKYRWKSSDYWNQISAADSNKIESVRTNPNTKFPAKVKVLYNHHDYEVILENGPYAQEAKAWRVKELRDESEESEIACDSDEVDMSAFQQSDRRSIQLKREQHCPTGFSEFIVYDTNQVKLKYLIELTSPTWLEKQWRKTNKVKGK